MLKRFATAAVFILAACVLGAAPAPAAQYKLKMQTYYSPTTAMGAKYFAEQVNKLTGGRVELKGEPVCGPSRKVGFMPQRDQLFEWRSIWGNVTLGLTVRGENTPQRQAHVRELLERYGLADFAQKRPSQLSGGMRQRCALIRTLAAQPKVLLLDEPFSALDYQTRLAVSADIYRIIRQEGKTALLVTHDISEAISLSDRVVVLSHRPAVVKSIHRLTQLQGVPPLQRRDHPAFAGYFKSIWKELEVHEG